jgi:Tfp pilus assembly ATPase PilU
MCPFRTEVYGSANEMITAPTNPTSSKVPGTGRPKSRPITSATVRNMMKATAADATQFTFSAKALTNFSMRRKEIMVAPFQ